VSRAPLRRHRPGLRGGVVETTGEEALGLATCHGGAQHTPSPLLDVVDVVGGVAGAGASAGAGDAGASAGEGAGGTHCTHVPRLG
jgi:hypothetical protein